MSVVKRHWRRFLVAALVLIVGAALLLWSRPAAQAKARWSSGGANSSTNFQGLRRFGQVPARLGTRYLAVPAGLDPLVAWPIPPR